MDQSFKNCLIELYLILTLSNLQKNLLSDICKFLKLLSLGKQSSAFTAPLFSSRLVCNRLLSFSSEPTVPGDEEEAPAASPEPEPEVEKEAEAPVVEPEVMLETQTDANTSDDQTEKSPAAAPTTAEPAAVPAEPTPAAPEENRVSLNEIEAGRSVSIFGMG